MCALENQSQTLLSILRFNVLKLLLLAVTQAELLSHKIYFSRNSFRSGPTREGVMTSVMVVNIQTKCNVNDLNSNLLLYILSNIVSDSFSEFTGKRFLRLSHN